MVGGGAEHAVRPTHCPRCHQNVDAVICPRCGVLTEPGLLRQPHRPKRHGYEPYEPTVYKLHLNLIRDGGVDVEAS